MWSLSILSLFGRPIFILSLGWSKESSPSWLLSLEALEPLDLVFLMSLFLKLVRFGLRK